MEPGMKDEEGIVVRAWCNGRTDGRSWTPEGGYVVAWSEELGWRRDWTPWTLYSRTTAGGVNALE